MRNNLLKISVAIFSFVIVYTFTWSIVEPIPIFQNNNWYKWYLILIVSSVSVLYGQIKKGALSFLYFRFCKPWFSKTLQVFTSGIVGTSLGEGWKYIHSPYNAMLPESREDILFNRVYEFRDDITHDATHGINAIAKQEGKHVDYFIKPLDASDPVIYILIEIRSKSDSHTEQKWLTLVIDKLHKAQTKVHGEKEEIISIASKAVYLQWMVFSEDIILIYNGITRWSENFTFSKIDSIKVRGDFQMSRLIIYA